jgi:acyl-CoA thioester hydrolase
MTVLYEARFQVTWADLDLNGHMANSRFLDYATQTRFLYAASRGFTPADFRRHGIGPVVFEDHLRYRKELFFLDEFVVTHQYEARDERGRKFQITNRFLRGDAEAAEVIAQGAWFDLQKRAIIVPPAELVQAISGA